MARLQRTRRAAGVVALGCAAAALAASPAAAQAPASPAPHTITVTGTAQVEPKPKDRKSNESIKKAVAKARREAIPLAIGNGQGRAATLSKLSGLPLGALISISSASPVPGPFYGPYFGEDGTFGPGRYCGTVRTAIRRTNASGRRVTVGTRTRRQCRVPQFVVSSLTLVYSTATA